MDRTELIVCYNVLQVIMDDFAVTFVNVQKDSFAIKSMDALKVWFC